MRKPTDLSRWEDFRDDVVTDAGGQSTWRVYAARDDVRFYASADDARAGRSRLDRGKDTGACASELMKQYIVLDGDADAGALHISVGPTTALALYKPDKVCGWARAEDFVLHTKPIADGRSGIRRKIIVVFDWRTLRELMARSDERIDPKIFEMSSLYTAPSRRAHARGSLAMVTFAYVYKIVMVDNERWFFVSAEDLLPTVGRDVTKKTWGWIPDTSVVEWDTREAVWPHPDRTRAANVYPYLPDAMKDAVSPGTGQAAIRDTALGKPSPARPRGTAPPYPIVNPSDPLDACKRRGFDCASVAFVGAIAFGEHGLVRDPDQIVTAQRELERMKTVSEKAHKELNIVFVVDATKSMMGFIEGIQKLAMELEAAIDRSRFPTGLSIQFGVVVYRDDYALHDAASGRIQVRELSSDLKGVARWMSRVKATQYDLDDRPEAMHCGLVEAGKLMSKAGAEGALNVLVVLGDHPSAARSCARGGATSVQRALAPHRPWKIHAFGLEHDRADVDGFVADVRGIDGMVSPGTSRFESQPISMGRESDMVRALSSTIHGLEKHLHELADRYEDMASGRGTTPAAATRPAPVPNTLQYEMTDAAREISLARYMELEGVTREEAERIWDRMVDRHATIQVPGFVMLTDPKGKPVSQKVVLYDSTSVDRYFTTLDAFVENPDTDNTLELWLGLCDHIAAEGSVPRAPIGAEARLAACKRFRGGVKFLDEHEILKRTPEEIKSWLASTDSEVARSEARGAIEKLMADAMRISDQLKEYTEVSSAPLWFTFGHQAQKYIWLRLPEDLL